MAQCPLDAVSLHSLSMRTQCGRVPPNLSLYADASPAALARRPLAAG